MQANWDHAVMAESETPLLWKATTILRRRSSSAYNTISSIKDSS